MTTEANRPAPIEGAKNDGASPENKALAGAPENKAAGTRNQASVFSNHKSVIRNLEVRVGRSDATCRRRDH